jgi:N-acetylmuramoyl-L-alanine amidase
MSMIRQRLSPNHDVRPDGTPIDMLVLHYTGMTSAAEAVDRLCDASAKVSSHYVVEEDGTVWSLVDENRRAWHAGVSCWRGARDINGRSIGIEIVNPGHEWGYRAFPMRQMQAVADLARSILQRHPIPARNVVGHSDIAPLRKQDPGELFDWRWLAAQGIGLWPDRPRAAAAVDQATMLLGRYGYDVGPENLAAVIEAFQRHFRPSAITGQFDEETLQVLAALYRLIVD